MQSDLEKAARDVLALIKASAHDTVDRVHCESCPLCQAASALEAALAALPGTKEEWRAILKLEFRRVMLEAADKMASYEPIEDREDAWESCVVNTLAARLAGAGVVPMETSRAFGDTEIEATCTLDGIPVISEKKSGLNIMAMVEDYPAVSGRSSGDVMTFLHSLVDRLAGAGVVPPPDREAVNGIIYKVYDHAISIGGGTDALLALFGASGAAGPVYDPKTIKQQVREINLDDQFVTCPTCNTSICFRETQGPIEEADHE